MLRACFRSISLNSTPRGTRAISTSGVARRRGRLPVGPSVAT
jgi:hypothetical protein